MGLQEEKRHRVLDLLSAQVPPKRIAEVVGVSLITVYNIRTANMEGKGPERSEGSGGHNKKRTDHFVHNLKAKVAEDPTKSMRSLAMDMNVSPKTLRKAVNEDLGLKSYTRTTRHLLTRRMKAIRLERCKKVRSY